MIEYKNATFDDIPKLIEIERSVVGNKTYSPMLEEDEWGLALAEGTVLLVLKGGEVVGNASFEEQDDDGSYYISGLVIMPQFQGRGLGRIVLAKVLADMPDARRITLVTHPDNVAARKLYTEAGFVVGDLKKNYYGDGEPRVMLVLTK